MSAARSANIPFVATDSGKAAAIAWFNASSTLPTAMTTEIASTKLDVRSAGRSPSATRRQLGRPGARIASASARVKATKASPPNNAATRRSTRGSISPVASSTA